MSEELERSLGSLFVVFGMLLFGAWLSFALEAYTAIDSAIWFYGFMITTTVISLIALYKIKRRNEEEMLT